LKRKKRKYTREFKIEAVRLCEEDGRPAAEVGLRLGVHPNNLYKWRAQIGEDGAEAFPSTGNLKASEQEKDRKRREVARLREENDILKASADVYPQSKQARFLFIHQHSEQFGVSRMCELLDVSMSGYYVWRKRTINN
jgi:transposase